MTNYAEKLISAFGPPENQSGPQRVSDTSNEIPDALRDLWLEHGFASYQQGFYWNTNPSDYADLRRTIRAAHIPQLRGRQHRGGIEELGRVHGRALVGAPGDEDHPWGVVIHEKKD